MTSAAVIDGARLLSWARRSAEALGRHREEINSLNVFPVPDSDTGSNMAFTMAAAVREAEDLAPEPDAGDSADLSASDVAEALAVGSIKGARGNSGVVLSQVLRGVAQAAAEGQLDGKAVAAALKNAVTFVERALSDPVEGTIISVLREAAAAAGEAAQGSSTSDHALSTITSAALKAAEEALARTPSQLAELREAGVVDAGGTGLVLLLSALHDEVGGGMSAADSDSPSHKEDPHADHSHGVSGWLEVMFMFSGPLDELEAKLSTMGRSLVIARASDTHGKVHIHTTEAGPVIERAIELGDVSDVRLEILPDASPLHEARRVGRLILAVTPAGSLMELYNQAGAVTVEPGPQVGEDMRREITAADAHEVIILPNGLIDQATLAEIEHAMDEAPLHITLLPTVRLVNGIAAVSVHDPRLPVAQAAELMREAAEEMAVADIVDSGNSIEVIAGGGASTNGSTAIASGEELEAVLIAACAAMLTGGGELVTLLLAPADAAVLDPDELEEKLDAEVVIYPADGLGSRGQLGVE